MSRPVPPATDSTSLTLGRPLRCAVGRRQLMSHGWQLMPSISLQTLLTSKPCSSEVSLTRQTTEKTTLFVGSELLDLRQRPTMAHRQGRHGVLHGLRHHRLPDAALRHDRLAGRQCLVTEGHCRLGVRPGLSFGAFERMGGQLQKPSVAALVDS